MSFLNRIFSRNPNSESKSESKIDDEKELESLSDPVLGECKFRSGKKFLYVTRARKILNSDRVSVWTLNRPLNVSHVDGMVRTFETEYKEYESITLPGSFAVFKQDDRFKIIDGQHRREALEKFLVDHPTFNPEITIELFETNDPVSLFNHLNQNLPQDPRHRPSDKKATIIRRLQEKYGDNIRDQRQVKRPRVLLKVIVDSICTSDFYDEYSVDEIMEKLESINAGLANLSMEAIFGREYDADPALCERIYNGASDSQFYLGMRKPRDGRLDWSFE